MKLTVVILLSALVLSCCPCKELRGTLNKAHIGMRHILMTHRRYSIQQLKAENLPDSTLCERLRAAELEYMKKITIDKLREKEADGVYVILRGYKYQ